MEKENLDWREQSKEIGKMLVSGIYWCLKGLGKILSDVFLSEPVKRIAPDSILNLTYDSYGNIIVDINTINKRIIPVLQKHLTGVKYVKADYTREGAYFISYSYLDFIDDRCAEDTRLLSDLMTRDVINSYLYNLPEGDIGQLDYYVICDGVTGSAENKIYVIFYAYPGSERLIDHIKKMIG